MTPSVPVLLRGSPRRRTLRLLVAAVTAVALGAPRRRCPRPPGPRPRASPRRVPSRSSRCQWRRSGRSRRQTHSAPCRPPRRRLPTGQPRCGYRRPGRQRQPAARRCPPGEGRPARAGGPPGRHGPTGAGGGPRPHDDRARGGTQCPVADRPGGRSDGGRPGRRHGRLPVVRRSLRGGLGEPAAAGLSARVRVDHPTARECTGTPLPSRNNLAEWTVSATAAGSLVAVSAAPSGPAGTYAATSLQPSSTWSAGGNSGAFIWSYPLRVPPAPGGPAPQFALNYSSQTVDGRHAASNNQPSWVGEGFEASPGGYIERRYQVCAEDMGGSANNTTKTGDLCWETDNAVLSSSTGCGTGSGSPANLTTASSGPGTCSRCGSTERTRPGLPLRTGTRLRICCCKRRCCWRVSGS